MRRKGATKNYIMVTAVGVLASVSAIPAATEISEFVGSGDGWTSSSNWSPEGVPEGPLAWAQIGAIPDNPEMNTLRIFYPSNFLTAEAANTLIVGAISFLPQLDNLSDVLEVQNNASINDPENPDARKGFLRFEGVDTEIAGQQRRLILDNSSPIGEVSFTQSLSGQEFELATSGAIHVAENSSLRLSTKITEDGSPRSITKIGEGILTFGNVRNLGNESHQSTYSGGFVLEEGIVQWDLSGSSSASAFGTDGSLTLRGGNLRSTTGTARSINVNVELDGGAAFGSSDSDFNGNITVNSVSGSLSTTVSSDSTLTIAPDQTTTWHQGTSGPGGLTKDGEGLLRFSGLGGDLDHGGNTVVAEGTLVVDGLLTATGAVEVLLGATLKGTGGIGASAEALTVRSGGILAFGYNNVGTTQVNRNLLMEDASVLVFNFQDLGVFDALQAFGAVELGELGAVSLNLNFGFLPNLGDTFVLIDNQSGSALEGAVSHDGVTLAEGDDFLVNIDGLGEQQFFLTYSYGESGFNDSLAIQAIPEPSTWALLAGGLVLLVAGLRRRRS